MGKLTEEFVREVFQEEGSYLSKPEDISEKKLCNETPKEIRDSILGGNHNDVEDTLKALEEIEEIEKVFNDK
ncbi:hypothetical protein [Helicobacter sp.]|uniref:hypothetical protein n=1 Tax=Helicobacter sp. TaxID=218 RepID=UPI0019AA898E|nr:hypothetical protein [Helicobacter sp.]MBD5165808.1 hypothetical protein [Helicobacter sp.]